MTISLRDGPLCMFVLESAAGDSRLIQFDWEFPALAAAFGWTPCCCGETDGTIDCEHRSVVEMISESFEFLVSRVGSTADDPGYFD